MQNHNVAAASLEEKVRFLASAAAHGGRGPVEAIETHMSWVFLVGDRAYKLKKPVKYPFLDFSTLAARETDCREELRLNARLAPGIYLGVVPLTDEGGRTLALEGRGPPVDWVVKMRRLPQERMLDRLIRKHAVTEADVDGLAGVLAQFYRSAAPVAVSPDAYLEHFQAEHDTNTEVLRRPAFDLPRAVLEEALASVGAFLTSRRDDLAARATSGRIVEGHGDLRPEHVCLLDPPVVFDCLEFNRAFRLVDPFDELAYLALECEHLGAAWIGKRIIERVDGIAGDLPSETLMAFYTAFRALLRCRLTLSHLMDPRVRTPEKWPPLARAYLAIAERAALTLRLRADRR